MVKKKEDESNTSLNEEMYGGQYKPLSKEDLEKIHNSTMKIFEEVGVCINQAEILESFSEVGAEVDFDRRIVKLSEDWLLKQINSAPSKLSLYGREEKYNLELENKKGYIGSGGPAPYTLDLETGERRPSTLRDLEDSAALTEVLDNIHFFSLSCFPNELSKENVDVNSFYSALKNTSKHIMGKPHSKEGVKKVVDTAEIIAGGKEALLKEPFISFIINSNSPLSLEEKEIDILNQVVESGLPLTVPAVPATGKTAPATLSGTLVQMNVETLMGVLLAQLSNPGYPVMYGCSPSVFSPTTGEICSGAIETGLMSAACAQLAGYYNLPSYTTAGINDSKVTDVQAGYESMGSILLSSLGTNNINNAAGLIDSGKTFSYEQLVICDDIIGMCMRTNKGLEISEDNLLLDAIKDTGPGNDYLRHETTGQYIDKEIFSNKISDRQVWEKWEDEGNLDGEERARDFARKVFSENKTSKISKSVENEIIKKVPGILDK